MRSTTIPSILFFATIGLFGSSTAHAQFTSKPVQGPNGNIYQVVFESGVTWAQANRNANELSIGGARGHLVTLATRSENFLVRDLLAIPFREDQYFSVWLGGFRPIDVKEPCDGWTWVNGEGAIPGTNDTPEYANWSPGELDSYCGVPGHIADRWYLRSATHRVDDSQVFVWSGGGFPHNISGYVVEYETGDGPMRDCNQNGSHDAIDLIDGTSADVDGDGVPDECAISFRLVESESPNVVSIMATTLIPMRGGEIGIAYDPTVVTPSCAEPGADFPGDQDDIFCDLDAAVNCAGEDDVAAGFTVGWVHGGRGELLAPGTYELLRVRFARGESGDVCSALRFVDCLGVTGSPVQNTVADEDNRGVSAQTIDGEICPAGASFRRGDGNNDGKLDISDAVQILGCLFLGSDCSTCPDANDTNDDSAINLSDATYLLQWRFLGGIAPPVPFVSCGADPTEDELADCIYDVAACP